MNKLTLKQMSLIAHAFGIDLFYSIMSHKLKDKILPNDFYRNRIKQNMMKNLKNYSNFDLFKLPSYTIPSIILVVIHNGLKLLKAHTTLTSVFLSKLITPII